MVYDKCWGNVDSMHGQFFLRNAHIAIDCTRRHTDRSNTFATNTDVTQMSLYLDMITRQWNVKQFILEHSHEASSLQGLIVFDICTLYKNLTQLRRTLSFLGRENSTTIRNLAKLLRNLKWYGICTLLITNFVTQRFKFLMVVEFSLSKKHNVRLSWVRF